MAVNGGSSVLRCAHSETLIGLAAQQADVEFPMRKQKKTHRPTWTKTVTVTIDLAACLRALALLVFLLT